MPTSPARIRVVALLAVASATLAAGSSAWAWGRVGHRASGLLAESLLSPKARAAVRDLLGTGETLADISTWADEVRHDRKESAPWHYVNVPFTEARYDPRFCPAQGCVVSAIARMRATLADEAAPQVQRVEALKFLVHFVQDLHQPLHVGHRNDRGGNDLQVQFFGRGSNLHWVWDSGIIERYSLDEAAWAKEIAALATPEKIAEWGQGSVEDWATESLLAAKIAYRDGALKKGAKLDESYQEAGLPIVKERLARSAVRVAALLNATFP